MISFIVPAYNEESELSSTLKALGASAESANQRYEIIVADDASTDATAVIAVQAGAKVISINRRQIAAARNAGAGTARGEYLFFVELEGHQADSRVKRALEALRRKTARLELLGSYPKA